MLFNLQVDICDRFHISPFQLRREKFSEFCLLVKRLKTKGKKEQKSGSAQEIKKDGKKKKYLPVTDYKPIRKEVAQNGG